MLTASEPASTSTQLLTPYSDPSLSAGVVVPLRIRLIPMVVAADAELPNAAVTAAVMMILFM